MEQVVGEQDLALQQHFPYKSSKFSENSNCCTRHKPEFQPPTPLAKSRERDV